MLVVETPSKSDQRLKKTTVQVSTIFIGYLNPLPILYVMQDGESIKERRRSKAGTISQARIYYTHSTEGTYTVTIMQNTKSKSKNSYKQ